MSAKDAKQPDDYKVLVKDAMRDEEGFLRLTLSKPIPKGAGRWEKIGVRCVAIKDRRCMQFSYFDGKKDITKNYSGGEIWERVDEALGMGFSQIHVQSASGDIHIRITRKDKVLITRARPSRTAAPILAHDRVKQYPLSVDQPDAFLQTIGIMDAGGKVRPSMQDKFRQINEFLRIVEQVIPERRDPAAPISIADCGCGRAHLTFAAYHYLNHVRDLPVRLVGVDISEELIAKCCKLRDSLGWGEVEFHVSSIAEFTPAAPPDIVLSLHACDTATDEAIAQGILWGARAILAAPCCQHELHHQLETPLFKGVLREGILRERLADILTDAFRALVLRIMGYRTDVIEFVSPEHTSKNLMIRSERTAKPGNPRAVEEYKQLKEFWNVSPVIEELLGDGIKRYL